VAVIATSIYLHRAVAHRSLTLHPLADVIFRAALWLTTGQSRQQRVAVHRKHHTFTDREGDPHRPRLLGFWRVQLFNVAYYMREARNPETLETFAPDLRSDRLDRVLFSHGVLGLGVGLSVLCTLIGLGPGLAAGLLHAGLDVFVLAPLINAARGHWRGARNFDNTASNWRLWPGSPAARVSTTTTTRTRGRRSSACGDRSSTPRGRSSGRRSPGRDPRGVVDEVLDDGGGSGGRH
jgi:stearoyl-CoA desaturase (delta-9 desaturase)